MACTRSVVALLILTMVLSGPWLSGRPAECAPAAPHPARTHACCCEPGQCRCSTDRGTCHLKPLPESSELQAMSARIRALGMLVRGLGAPPPHSETASAPAPNDSSTRLAAVCWHPPRAFPLVA